MRYCSTLALVAITAAALTSACVSPPVARDYRPEGDPDGTVFRDCPQCPEMVVVLAGRFLMGSRPDEPGRTEREGPQRSSQFLDLPPAGSPSRAENGGLCGGNTAEDSRRLRLDGTSRRWTAPTQRDRSGLAASRHASSRGARRLGEG